MILRQSGAAAGFKQLMLPGPTPERCSPKPTARPRAASGRKSRFMGVELTGKTLGIIGAGNIGAIVAERALGLKMMVIAFDPFLAPERARELGIEKVEFERPAEALGFHYPAHAAHRFDPPYDRQDGDRPDEAGRAHHQLRTRRPGRRGATSRRPSPRARSQARRSTCSKRRAGQRRMTLFGVGELHRDTRISAPRPRRRRRTSRCRSPSRSPTT